MYTLIDSSFWTDQLMRKLPEDAKFLMFYFLTTPSRNLIGFFVEPEPMAIYRLGWNVERYQAARQVLIDYERIAVDKAEDLILIPNFLKWNTMKSINCVKSAVRKFRELPVSQLFKQFYTSLEKIGKYEELLKVVEERIETLQSVETKIAKLSQMESKSFAPKEPPAKVKEFVFVFNETLGDVLPKVREITKDRINKITEIIKRFGREDVARVFSNIKDSDFLCGKIKGNSWKCSFDWMIQEKIFVKILEGTYNNNNAKSLPRAFQDIEDAMNGVGEGEITEYDQR